MKFESLKGPFEIFSVGGDISDANVVKFSNDGRLMLLTTMDGHIHVLDSFRGTLVSYFPPTLKKYLLYLVSLNLADENIELAAFCPVNCSF